MIDQSHHPTKAIVHLYICFYRTSSITSSPIGEIYYDQAYGSVNPNTPLQFRSIEQTFRNNPIEIDEIKFVIE